MISKINYDLGLLNIAFNILVIPANNASIKLANHIFSPPLINLDVFVYIHIITKSNNFFNQFLI